MTAQNHSNYYAVLDETALIENDNFPFKRGEELIYATRMHTLDSPWFPDIYSAQRFLKENGFANIFQQDNVGIDTPMEGRIFKKDGLKYSLLSYQELQKRLYDEGKREIFDNNLPKIKPRKSGFNLTFL